MERRVKMMYERRLLCDVYLRDCWSRKESVKTTRVMSSEDTTTM